MSLRTPLQSWKYKRHLSKHGSAPLCDLPAIKEWHYWKLVEPLSKHNRHHKQHLMIVLKRPCDNMFDKLTNNEWMEMLRSVLKDLDDEYDYFKINFKSMRTVNGYVHYHVMVLKKRYK